MFGENVNALAENIAGCVQKHLTQNIKEDAFPSMMAEVHSLAEAESKNSLTKEELSHMDCKTGCSTCCRVNVPVLLPEAYAIVFWIKENMPVQLPAVEQKLQKLYRDISYLDDDERVIVNRPCAFLDNDGGCSIYPVRPLICRSVTSADAAACRDSVTLPLFGENATVPMNIKQRNIMETAFLALADALDSNRYDSRSREITPAVLKIIQADGYIS
jgi:Fe-S-cluster containining protein